MKGDNNQALVVSERNTVEFSSKLPKIKKARFVKLDIDIKDQPVAKTMVNIFTFLPIPLAIGKMFSKVIVNKINEKMNTNFTKKDFKRIINAAKGLTIDVESGEANVKIKIL